ncbi:MAG: hypothetical protein IPJ85_05850 [Flavobacteriales bacterium]|nr:hypothetical protein [Flavobacteriales bacterium]
MNALRLLILPPVLLIASLSATAQTRTVSYQWLNQPCAEMINCEGGCSACNQPDGDQVVLGTNAALIGVSACPHPFAVGDNALLLSGWSSVPDDSHRLVASVMSMVNVRIDSVIVVHKRVDDGPRKLLASVNDLAGSSQAVIEAPTPEQFGTTVLVMRHCHEGRRHVVRGFQIRLQAFDGEGAWYLDELRIVMSELAEELPTAIEDVHSRSTTSSSIPLDLLGRTTAIRGAQGMRLQGSRIVVVQ